MENAQKVLSQEASKALELARKLPLSRFYLAGGTALALQCAHRRSVDFDFFTGDLPLDFSDREMIKSALKNIETSAEIEKDKDKTLILRILGVRVSFFYYPYPLLEPLVDTRLLRLASIWDIGAMKLSAIVSRGTKRDFVDLYEIAQHIPLESLLKRASGKYAQIVDFPFQALKSMAYFEDAETEPMPFLLKPFRWEEIRAFFERQVSELSRRWLS